MNTWETVSLSLLLQYPELNKIRIREKENKEKERAGERAKILKNYLKVDVIEVQLNSISDFLEWYDKVNHRDEETQSLTKPKFAPFSNKKVCKTQRGHWSYEIIYRA